MDYSDSIEISVPSQVAFAAIADLPAMGRRSPENTGGEWLNASGPAPGARFRGDEHPRWFDLGDVRAGDGVRPSDQFRLRSDVPGVSGVEVGVRSRADRRGVPGHREVEGPPQLLPSPFERRRRV